MKHEIKQNGTTILESDDNSLKMIFKNLIGANFKSNIDYRDYIEHLVLTKGLSYGIIELYVDGEVTDRGIISKQKLSPNTMQMIINNKRLDKSSIGYQIGMIQPTNPYTIYWDDFKREELKREFKDVFGIEIK